MLIRTEFPALSNLSVFCADVGSIKKGKFGWAASLAGGRDISGNDIEELAENLVSQIRDGRKVAIGLECPLFVPVRRDPRVVNAARSGEGNRSWSAGAGAGALATGLVELIWVMNRVKESLGRPPRMAVRWNEFLKSDAVFVWEAFVTSTAKGHNHSDDARIAITHFQQALPDPWSRNAIAEKNVFSLLGAAALRAGWSNDIEILSAPCLVIKAEPRIISVLAS